MKKNGAALIEKAFDLGVSDVRIIPVDRIPIDPKFADFCREPGCPGYGKSKSCPPHVMGPEKFRQFIRGFDDILVFKFDIPWPVLLSNDRLEVNRVVHETAAGLERFALELGYERARGFAGGSCRELFCASFPECRVLAGDGTCRHPDQSRESMSGMGVDFTALAAALGWEFKEKPGQGGDGSSHGLMAGSVLLG